ncbi:MAG: diaminopropionate ammonia-lyase, partial [Oscillospiraceae bacterium]
MKEDIKIFSLPGHRQRSCDLTFLSMEQATKVHGFHASFPMYKKTPLKELKNTAQALGLGTAYVKDESYRFGLNAFKVLGGSYAIGSFIANKLGTDISELPYEKMISKDVRAKLGELTFVTATDGNHGRGVAWTAKRLGQRSVVYMPKGSSAERLANIWAEGADACITDLNYDEAVRLASRKAEEKGWIMVQDTAWDGYEDIPRWIMQGYGTLGYEAYGQLPERPTH